MTVSILGCGWMGLPLGVHLAGRGHRVKGSTTTPEKRGVLAQAGIAPYLIRLDEPDFDPGDFFDADVLFLNVPPRRREPDVEARYRAWMERVAAALRGAPVRLVVFAGSTSVYADLGREVTEDDAGAPETASGRALLDAERLFREAPGYETTVLRFAGLYGYERRIGRFLAGKTDVPGGDAPVNLVHRDDCIAVVTAVVEVEAGRDVWGEVFNVCADEHPTRRQLYVRAAERQGFAPPTFLDGADGFKVVSNRRLKQRLGYRFRYPDPLQDAP